MYIGQTPKLFLDVLQMNQEGSMFSLQTEYSKFKSTVLQTSTLCRYQAEPSWQCFLRSQCKGIAKFKLDHRASISMEGGILLAWALVKWKPTNIAVVRRRPWSQEQHKFGYQPWRTLHESARTVGMLFWFLQSKESNRPLSSLCTEASGQDIPWDSI